MRKILILMAVVISFDVFAKIEVCENVLSSENLISPNGTMTIHRNAFGFDIVSKRREDAGKLILPVKILFSRQTWEYLWSEDSRFLKAVQTSGQGRDKKIEALFVVDFSRNFVLYPYVQINNGDNLERLQKVSLMGERYLLSRYGDGSTYEIIDIANGAVVKSTLKAKNEIQKKGRFAPQTVKISPGDLPESL